MAINQLSTANTFEQWLIATQILIEKSNFFEDTSNLVFDTANSVFDVYANTLIIYDDIEVLFLDTQNLYNNVVSLSTEIYDTANNILQDTLNTSNGIVETALIVANTVLEKANDASNTANLALFTANVALETANTIFANVFTIVEESSSANNFYLTFTSETLGIPEDVFIDSAKLYYNPNTGQLNATNFNSLSDMTLKSDIQTLNNALDSVLKMRGVSFKWKENGQKTIGVIAQEVEKVIPEIVSTNKYGEKSVSYGNMIGLLIESIKDLEKEISELKKHK